MLGLLSEYVVPSGRFAEARALGSEVGPVAELVGNHAAISERLDTDTMLNFCETGDAADLEAAARRYIQFSEETGLGWTSWGWRWVAVAEFLRGRWEEAVDLAQKAEELCPPGSFEGLGWALEFEYRAYLGQRDITLAMLDTKWSVIPRQDEPAGFGPWIMLLSAVEGLVVLGERDRAAELYPAVCHCLAAPAW